MVFSSSLFLLYFFPLFLLVYFLSAVKHRNIITLIASVFFYSWGAPDFIFIVLFSIFIDYYIVEKIYSGKGNVRRWLLGISVMLNVGLLAYFKYANFFVDNLNAVLMSFGA